MTTKTNSDLIKSFPVSNPNQSNILFPSDAGVELNPPPHGFNKVSRKSDPRTWSNMPGDGRMKE